MRSTEKTLNTAAKTQLVWRYYPVFLFALLVVVLLSLFLFAAATVTLDGYSHIYGGEALKLMLGGQPDFHSNFSYNSILLPNWLDSLLLAALSSLVPNELALKLLIVLIILALVSSLYFCIDSALYQRHQRAQVLIVLLPFALNAFLTLGFYDFLISSSLCFFVLGLLLRHGLKMPLRFQYATACLLLIAYFCHPLPVIISFLYPGSCFIADAIIHWRDGWRHSATALKRHAFDIWPWLPVAGILPWFYLRLSKSAGPDSDVTSMAFNLTHRSVFLTRDAILSVSPTADVGTLIIALLTILLAGALVGRRKHFMQNWLRFTSLTVLMVSITLLYFIVPDKVGDGLDIASRFLLYSAIFLVLLALTTGPFDAKLLTLCSLVAALSVIGFAGEYWLVSKRLAPSLAEVRLAMESIPRHSRILIMGYRMTPPTCVGSPLLEMSAPERHWALAGALKNELIVLNDYQAHTSHFPLKYLNSRYASVINEVDLDSERNKVAWSELLNSDPYVDFVVSWGISRGISGDHCKTLISPPFEETLKNRYDMVLSSQGTSRVEVWRQRR
jgi:hypothetical protein